MCVRGFFHGKPYTFQSIGLISIRRAVATAAYRLLTPATILSYWFKPMDFSLTSDQQNIREAVLKHCSQFPDDYWLERDHEGVFPHEFFKSMVDAGWLGIAMPTEFGGSGLGITEAAVMMQAIAESGAGMSGASSIHLPVFGL